MKCGIKINKSIEAFPIFITRKNGKMEKEVFTINLLFLYYPILLGFLLFFWNDNRLLPLVILPPYGCQNPLPKRMSF